MASGFQKLVTHISQEFQPIAFFYTAILIEMKKFTIAELSNRIFPLFFYASLLMMGISFMIAERLRYESSILCLSMVQVLMLFLVIVMPVRFFSVAQLIYVLGGATSSYRNVIRSFLLPSGSDTKQSSSLIKLYRYVTLSASGWIGQELFNQTGKYDLIIAISFIMTLISLVLAICSRLNPMPVDQNISKQEINSLTELVFKAFKAFTREFTVPILAGCTTTCMQMYLSIYSHTLFREKISSAKDGSKQNALSSKFVYLIRAPARYISFIIIRISQMLGFNCVEKIKVLPDIESGYIEGTVKICAGLVNILLVGFIEQIIGSEAFLYVMPFAIIAFTTLIFCKSMRYSKWLYFISLSLILLTDTMAKNKLQMHPNKVFLANLCLFIECVLHSLIGVVCRVLDLQTSTKGRIYSGLATMALLCAVILRLTNLKVSINKF